MKRFLLLTAFLLSLFSCSNDIEFNEHTFQVVKDNEFWKAIDFNATINEDGYLSITGVSYEQTVTLYLESAEPGIYDLGDGSNSTAWYLETGANGYTTEYQGDGEVVIEKYDPVDQTITGTFRFNAFTYDGEVANFNMGIFYRVPMVNKPEAEDLNELRATIDNVEMIADELEIVKEDGIIEVLSTSSDGRSITLFLPETITAGSHNLNEQSASGTYAIYGYANGVTSTAQYGTLFINEHDIAAGMIKGSFGFTTLLPNSVSVENGSFTIYY